MSSLMLWTLIGREELVRRNKDEAVLGTEGLGLTEHVVEVSSTLKTKPVARVKQVL